MDLFEGVDRVTAWHYRSVRKRSTTHTRGIKMKTATITDRRTALAVAWLRYNGQRGTAKQVAKIKHTEETLERMLAARGVTV